MPDNPIIMWFRADLRLRDNPALAAAVATGKTIIPVYIQDDEAAGIWRRGAASRWWLHHSLQALDSALQKAGFHPLVYFQGAAASALQDLIATTKADTVFWNRCYEPWAMKRDKAIKSDLRTQGLEAQSFQAGLLFEPWDTVNKSGSSYKVYTPFSKACFERADHLRPPIDKATPQKKHTQEPLIKGKSLLELQLRPDIKWYKTMAAKWTPGEDGAQRQFSDFLTQGLATYKSTRDFPADESGISHLSPHLHFGEISPHQIWHDARAAIAAHPQDTIFFSHAHGWLRQLLWREFSYHLLYHAPDFPEQPWNKRFTNFAWQQDDAALDRWKHGQTGYPIVDAGMRELWQTGWMHNRVRMIVGSFLVKNLLLHWREGEDWFWDTLVDADLGNNAAGWQWIAGCGADAAPYFRVFNPVLQSKKFDPNGAYIRRYVPELAEIPDAFIHTPWDAPPMIRNLAKNYPSPMVDLSTSRDRALKTYAESK